jgi:hypothetical protein
MMGNSKVFVSDHSLSMKKLNHGFQFGWLKFMRFAQSDPMTSSYPVLKTKFLTFAVLIQGRLILKAYVVQKSYNRQLIPLFLYSRKNHRLQGRGSF